MSQRIGICGYNCEIRADVLSSHGLTAVGLPIHDPLQSEDFLQRVQDCEIFLFIFEKDVPCESTLIQLGAALGLGKTIVLEIPYDLQFLNENPFIRSCHILKFYHPSQTLNFLTERN